MLKTKQRGGRWQVTGTVNGERIRKSVEAASKHEAEERRIEMEVGLVRRARLGKTLGEVAVHYNQVRAPHKTVQCYVKRIAGQFGGRDVGEVTLEDVRVWAERKGVGPASIRKYVGFAKTLLLYGEKAGMYELRRRPRCAVPQVPPGRDRFLETSDEVEALVACADAWFKPLVRFLFGTGARLGEALAVTDKDIVLRGNTRSVKLVTRKGAGNVRVRYVPLSAKVWADVQPLVKSGPVFVSPVGGKLFSQKVYQPWDAMCERAGVEAFTPHDARRTFATLLIRKGVDPWVVAQLLGHASTAMLKTYAYLAPNQMAQTVEMI